MNNTRDSCIFFSLVYDNFELYHTDANLKRYSP